MDSGGNCVIVIMKQGATHAQIVNITARIEQISCRVHISEGKERTIVGIIGKAALWIVSRSPGSAGRATGWDWRP
jgi:DAHP synthase ferredoxin-like domain